MSYTVKVLPNEPIIWETWGADFDPQTEAEQTAQQELNILDASSQPMVAVVDVRAFPLSWDDIIYLASHSVPDELNHHPRLRRIILITSSEIVSVAAQGMNSEAFGFVKMDIVASPEEALALARRFLA